MIDGVVDTVGDLSALACRARVDEGHEGACLAVAVKQRRLMIGIRRGDSIGLGR